MKRPALLQRPWRDPLGVLAAFADEPFACGLIGDGSGWSYVLRAPAETLTFRQGADVDPFSALRGLIGPRRERHPDGPPFQGGVVALAAYELAAFIEPLTLERALAWPDLAAGRYESLLAFDHAGRRVFAIGASQADAEAADAWLDMPSPGLRADRLAEGFRPLTTGSAYETVVKDVRRRIGDGEIFQANLARAWGGRLSPGVAPIDAMARLLEESPAPFSAYLRLPGLALVSNSPERFVRLTDGEAMTQPIKGTRPRRPDPAADAQEAADLLASAKDRAENLMIVDLMRNDLARVAAPGSVEAGPLFALESFANVHHLVSTVRARMAQGRDAVDLLRAAFPPGSITGAPKIQAMKVIAGLESPRGPYCGALLWAAFNGDMDSSVLIRSLAFEQVGDGWRFEARAGAGLTADSDPAAERAETEAKISALARALTGERL